MIYTSIVGRKRPEYVTSLSRSPLVTAKLTTKKTSVLDSLKASMQSTDLLYIFVNKKVSYIFIMEILYIQNLITKSNK